MSSAHSHCADLAFLASQFDKLRGRHCFCLSMAVSVRSQYQLCHPPAGIAAVRAHDLSQIFKAGAVLAIDGVSDTGDGLPVG